MSAARFLVFTAIIACAGLWVLSFRLIPPQERGAYTALVCGEEVPDREICQRLENQGFSGLVCESGQWVLLDCFGTIEQIPLDEYPSRIIPSDPRNDGYADKLRSLFIQDGRRYIYIPIGSSMAFKPAMFDKRIAIALGDIPYSIENAPVKTVMSRTRFFSLLMFFLAICAFFIIDPLRRALKTHAACYIPCLLIFSPLASSGAAGCALAGLLAGFTVLSAELYLGRLSLPRALPWILLPLLVIVYGTIAFFSAIPMRFALIILAALCIMLILSLRSASRIASGWSFRLSGFLPKAGTHRRFFPVTILKRHSSGLTFLWAMLPFAVSMIILTGINFVLPVSTVPSSSLAPSSVIITEEDYYAHCRFQSVFSRRPLYEPDSANGINVFVMGSDGLLEFAFQEEDPLIAMPPFPLSNFFNSFSD